MDTTPLHHQCSHSLTTHTTSHPHHHQHRSSTTVRLQTRPQNHHQPYLTRVMSSCSGLQDQARRSWQGHWPKSSTFPSPCPMVGNRFGMWVWYVQTYLHTKQSGTVLNHTLSNLHLIIATPFTQAGYVGEDVEMVIHRLLQVSSCDDTM